MPSGPQAPEAVLELIEDGADIIVPIASDDLTRDATELGYL